RRLLAPCRQLQKAGQGCCKHDGGHAECPHCVSSVGVLVRSGACALAALMKRSDLWPRFHRRAFFRQARNEAVGSRFVRTCSIQGVCVMARVAGREGRTDVLTTTDGAAAIASLRRVSWGAIFGGVVISLIVQFLLSMLGVGIGVATVDP